MVTDYFQYSLPAQLKDSELQDLLERIYNGEKEHVDTVVNHNLRLVMHIARKFQNTGYDLNELFSIGCVGLLKAAKTFNPNKAVKFATYAARCINNDILMELRKSKKSVSNTINLEFVLATDNSDGNELTIQDVIEDGARTDNDALMKMFGSDQMEIFKLYMKHANEQSQQIWFYTFLDATQYEISRILGLSQSYISRIMKKDAQAMKNMLQYYQETGKLVYLKRRSTCENHKLDHKWGQSLRSKV